MDRLAVPLAKTAMSTIQGPAALNMKRVGRCGSMQNAALLCSGELLSIFCLRTEILPYQCYAIRHITERLLVTLLLVMYSCTNSIATVERLKMLFLAVFHLGY